MIDKRHIDDLTWGSSSDPIISRTSAPTATRGSNSQIVAGIVAAAVWMAAVIACASWWLIARRRRRNAATTAYGLALVRGGRQDADSRKAKLDSLEHSADPYIHPSNAEIQRLRETVAVLNSRLRDMESDVVSEALPVYNPVRTHPL